MKRFGIAMGLALVLATPGVHAGVGSLSLVDASGLEYFINSDVTFTTSSMASGAASNATYTTSVTATTSAGGSTVSLLSDAFEGYSNLFVNGTVYNMNGGTTPDGACSNRQFEFAEQMIGDLAVSRKVFVPDNDAFCRWLNIIRNTGASAVDVTVIIVNNLGSGTDTVLATTSTPPAAATTVDNWAVSYEDYAGGVSPSPRLGHVFQGPNHEIGLSTITFITGNGQPFWEYTFSLPAGSTYILMNFVTGQPSKIEAITKCEELVGLSANAVACMAEAERMYVVNFDLKPPTVTMTSSVNNPTNVTPIPITVNFSEPVMGFELGDIVPTNGTVGNFSGSGASYSFDLTPAGQGAVQADIAAGVAIDAAGNGNTVAQTFNRDFDNVGPTVTMTSTTPDPTNIITVIPVTVTFSKPVTGFNSSDVTALGAELKNFSGSGDTYYFSLTPLRIVGTVGADILANVCADEAGNPNSAATPFRREVKPVQSCFNRLTPKNAGQPVKATLGEALPMALAAATLLGLGERARRRRRKD